MEASTTVISGTDLQRTLYSIYENNLRVNIRFRTLGQFWYPNFVRVLKIEDGKSILFHDEGRKFFFSLRDFSVITEFEIDNSLDSLEPNFHYQVTDRDFKIT